MNTPPCSGSSSAITKAEQVSVEPLRDLLIGDPQIDVANTFNLIMALFDLSTKDTAKVMRPRPRRKRGAVAPEGDDHDPKIAQFIL